MATTVVGLDIGSFAVRAAELSVAGGAATLNRFGQVSLVPGAVVDGEVKDEAAVAAAVKRLWSEAGFSAKQVVVGVANHSVLVRHADLADMAEDELAGALRFEAEELLPIAVDDAILDAQIIQRFPAPEHDPEAEARMRVLLVAAQRDMVRSHLAAVDKSGLGATAVDLVPLALLRSLGEDAQGLPRVIGGAEALVCIGGGVTNVVVHEGATPKLVRVLPVGGDDVTEALAAELEIDIDAAEDLKRRADAESDDPAIAHAGAVVAQRLAPIVEEIRGSLDYYLAQTEEAAIERVVVTGGGARIPGLVERLGKVLGCPVVAGHPLSRVKVGKTGLSQAQLLAAEDLLSIPIGLALGGAPAVAGAGHRISLLPGDVAEKRRQRRQLTMTAGAVAGVAAMLMGAWAVRAPSAAQASSEASQAERNIARLQAQVAKLHDVTALQQSVTTRSNAVRAALANDTSYPRVLRDLAAALPQDVWMTGLVVTSNPKGTTVTISLSGPDQSAPPRTLDALAKVPSIEKAWVAQSTQADSDGHAVVAFQVTASLTEAARSGRADVLVPPTTAAPAAPAAKK